MPHFDPNRLEQLDSGLLVARSDGAISSLLGGVNHGLLSNRATGMGYGGSGYTQIGQGYLLAESELRSLYRSNWLIRRVCDLPAEDMSKCGIQLAITDGDDTDVNRVMARWRSPLDGVLPHSRKSSYGFDKAKKEAERWARLFGSAYIVLDINEHEDPSKPITHVTSINGLTVLDTYSLHPYSQSFAEIDVEYYQLIYGRSQLELPSGQIIHESRVLPYFGNEIHPYDQREGFAEADSVIQSMWEAFCSHYEIKSTVQEAVNSFSLLTVSISNLSQLLAAGKESTVKKHLQEIGLQKSLYKVLVTDPEASRTGFEGRNLSGVRENVAAVEQDLTAATGLPYFKIWGTAGRVGLSDSGNHEARAYAQLISTLQRSKHQANDERIIKILSELELGRIPDNFEINYPSIYEPTEEEVLDGRYKTAQTYQVLATIPGAVTSNEFRHAIATGQPLESAINLDEDSEVVESGKEDSAELMEGKNTLLLNQVPSFLSMATSHNTKNRNPSQFADSAVLQEVYRRGLRSHNNDRVSRVDWANGRVQAYLKLLANGKPKNNRYTQDNDLLPIDHKRSTRFDESALLSNDEWDKLAAIREIDVLNVLGEALGE